MLILQLFCKTGGDVGDLARVLENNRVLKRGGWGVKREAVAAGMKRI